MRASPVLPFLLAGLYSLAACTSPSTPGGLRTMALSACHLPGSGGGDRLDAQCGTLTVWEDRRSHAGRRLGLRVAVVRATGQKPAKDALFILAGGPGQAATEVYGGLAPSLSRINLSRDIVLVDQRGTGSTADALACPALQLEPTTEDLAAATARAARCGGEVAGDASQYTTAIAMDDLDDAREALGYDTIDLYGGSYGTRAALVYLRRHPAHVRAVVLDGVAPPDWPLGATFGRDAQRALDRVFARCAADPECGERFPHLPQSLNELLAAHATPQQLTVPDPRTGEPTPVLVSRDTIAATLHGLSYACETASLLPLLIHTAHATGDLRPMAAQALLLRDLARISAGMHLAVACSEDAPFLDPARFEADNAGSYAGSTAARSYVEECRGWTRAALGPDDRAPVVSDAPVLLLSGELDPVTPPANAATAARTLPNSLQLTVSGEGHGVLPRGCTRRIVTDFLERAKVAGLDTACLSGRRALPFFTSFTGPPP